MLRVGVGVVLVWSSCLLDRLTSPFLLRPLPSLFKANYLHLCDKTDLVLHTKTEKLQLTFWKNKKNKNKNNNLAKKQRGLLPPDLKSSSHIPFSYHAYLLSTMFV
jgi:hypothetical protein